MYDNERAALDRLANNTLWSLNLGALTTFGLGVLVLRQGNEVWIWAEALIGMAGSALTALTSCLDRYAIGYEFDDGEVYPAGAKADAGKFNRRFARWLWVRPFLGAIVAPVFIWGISQFAKRPEEFLVSSELLGFTSFMGGLLAKSVLALIRDLFKNIFKA